MSYHDELKAAALALAATIKEAGFRAYIAEKGTYGFYTDAEGTRVVSFQFEFGAPKFSGNYNTSAPKSTGTGWVIGEVWPVDADALRDMYAQNAPTWAVGNAKWRHTTLAEHIAMYGASSRYVEV